MLKIVTAFLSADQRLQTYWKISLINRNRITVPAVKKNKFFFGGAEGRERQWRSIGQVKNL